MFKFVAVFGSLVLNTFTTVPSSSLAVARHVKFRGDRFVFSISSSWSLRLFFIDHSIGKSLLQHPIVLNFFGRRAFNESFTQHATITNQIWAEHEIIAINWINRSGNVSAFFHLHRQLIIYQLHWSLATYTKQPRYLTTSFHFAVDSQE